jgi:amidase
MGASIPSLKIMFQSLLSTKPWLRDPDVINIPWRTEIEAPKNEHLTFGFMQHDGIVQPHAPITRALQIVAEALKAKGHKAHRILANRKDFGLTFLR